MATARPTVSRLATTTTAPATKVNPATGVTTNVPPATSGSAIEADDLCNCGHAYAAQHPSSSAACSFARQCGCMGLQPR